MDNKHIRRKENKVTDALSRRVHEMHPTAISMNSLDLRSRILEAAIADQHFMLRENYSRVIRSRRSKVTSCKRMEFSCAKEEFMFLILWN